MGPRDQACGFRVIARKGGDGVRLYSRPGNSLTDRFLLIVEALAVSSSDCSCEWKWPGINPANPAAYNFQQDASCPASCSRSWGRLHARLQQRPAVLGRTCRPAAEDDPKLPDRLR
jgi:hypothetical protein